MTAISLKELTAAEIAEIQSPNNLWYTGEKLGHPPSRNEAAEHYIENNGPKNLRRRLSAPNNQNSP